MPLNYSKWDALELSDDSDIEVHPNVDKKSFINWKQRDIHEKRELRKREMQDLRDEIALNARLDGKIGEVLGGLSSEGSTSYSRTVSQLTAEREANPNKANPTPSDMVLSLLLQINEAPSVKGKSGNELDEALTAQLKEHREKLAARTLQASAQLKGYEEEEKRKITSDGIREGWSSGHVSKAEPEEAPAPEKPKSKARGKATTTTIETLNSPSVQQTSPDSDADDSDDESVPALTPAMSKFIDLEPCVPKVLPLEMPGLPPQFNPKRDLNTAAFASAYEYIGKNRALLRKGSTDALLVEAFQACMRGDAARGRRATEKGLMVQYCEKLGRDGVSLFFQRMNNQDGRAAIVFFNDVLSTFTRILTRSKALAAEQPAASGGVEQIQLVAEDPNTVIGFEVPDGPPPEKIELEGEGSENMDPERVRAFLQRRWDIFTGFAPELQEALKTKELDKVNKVLGDMPCDDAEKVVGLLDEAGILSFSSSEIRDDTAGAAA